MELICEKYKKKMAAEGACCNHPTEYCKFRTSCMIQFVAKEEGRTCQNGAQETKNDQADPTTPGEK